MSRKASVNVDGDHVECKQCTCMPPKSQNIAECDSGERSLKNWEKWIAKRKQIHNHLSKSLERPAGDLLMNLDDEYRNIQEERLIFGYCQINTYFDRSRGNPAFWKVPVGLTEPKCGRTRNNPTYFANMTKIEQNEIPLVKYVATPNYIKDEKNVLPRRRFLYTTRHNKKGTNVKMLASKINQIEPYRPKCEQLIVIGEKLEPPKEKPDGIDDSEESNIPRELQNNASATEEINATPSICFVLNETVISGYNELENSLMKIRLVYDCTTEKVLNVQYLKFKNIGLKAIRFYWNQIEKFLLFEDLIKSNREDSHSFYFNKNELLLPPDESVDFPIWFKSTGVGNYFEMWEITTKPKMWDDDFKLILNLQAFVYPEDFDEKCKDINAMLDERVGNTAIRGCLNDIFLHLKFKESKTDNFFFTEKQLFESANQEIWGVEKRPKYVYDKEAVRKLKALYEEVRLRYASKYWNYSIKSLRMLARKKDIWMYVENETKEMLKGKQRRIELNSLEQENVENSAQTTEKNVELEDAHENYCRRLDSILQGLERPSIISNTERSKYFTVYCILRNFCFKMCYVLAKHDNPTDSLTDDCYPCYDYRGIYTIEQLPERLIFERFDDVWIGRTKKNPTKNDLDVIATPKPDILKGISTNNYNAVFRLYYNLPDTNEKIKKDKTSGKYEERLIKEQEKLSKCRRETQTPDQISYQIPREGFDPFGEEYVADIFEKEPKPKNQRIQFMYQTNVDYMKYIIVCTYLIEAVDAMVDALESFKDSTLDIEVLGEITKCTEVNITELQFLPKEERLSVQEKHQAATVASTLKIEEDPYFHNLLDNHLNKNLHTKEYIVEGRRKISREESMPPNCQDSLESGSLDSWVFKSGDTIAESSVKSTASAEIQTSIVDDFKDINNELDESSTSSSSSEKVSEDIFCFIDEEEEVLKEEKPNV